MARLRRACGVLLAALVLAAAPALAAPQRVENFGLLDQNGAFHELYRESQRPAIVLFVQGNGCPIVRKNLPMLQAVRRKFAPLGVEFWMINSSPQDDLDEIAAEAKEWGIDFPILKDDARLVAHALDLERTAEALVIDPKTWQIVYRGPLDDRLGYETERPVKERYLEDALTHFMAGEPIETRERMPQGCLIRWGPEPDVGAGAKPDESHEHEHHHDMHMHPEGGAMHPEDGGHGEDGGQSDASDPGDVPSYARDVAPILAERCRTCHRDGGVAPWQMTDWPTVHGWAPMMREVLRTGRMPPWRVDPRYGRFTNDLSLPSAERATLVRWIEAAAPRGDGPDPLVTHPAKPAPEWPLGKPDLLLEAPEQQIPATGILPYRYERLEVPVDHDLWIRGCQLRPTNPAVMHHAIAWVRYPRGYPRANIQGPRGNRGQFTAYVPGHTYDRFPEGTAFKIPKGSQIRLQIHYQVTGRPEVDQPQLALYLADGPAEHELKVGAAADFDFAIPPHAVAYEVDAGLDISRDILVYSFAPHMHYRGKSMRYDLRYPDGTRQTLLSVPRYDFNWQHTYILEKPLAIPAGSHLTVTAIFDNSESNPANPNPDTWVRWGRQSYDEMMFGYFVYRDRGETESAARWQKPWGEQHAAGEGYARQAAAQTTAAVP